MHTAHLVVLFGVLLAQPADMPPYFAQHKKTGTFYYTSPDPKLGTTMLTDLLKKENIEHPWFAKNDHVLMLLGAQLGDIAAGQPEIVRTYEKELTAAPLLGRRVIVRALMNCGDDETVKEASQWLAGKQFAEIRAELEALKKHLKNPERKHVRDLPAAEPKDLDLLWANFFITGEYAPISRILDVLDLPAAPENATLQRVARWSLGSNLQQHPQLVELAVQHVKERPEGSGKVVDDLLVTLNTVVGRWLSQDADQEPLVFEKDGSFKSGFIKEKGAWVMAAGQYVITGEGKVQTRAQHAGATITQTYTLTGGVITGSRGPNPRVEWKKAKP